MFIKTSGGRGLSPATADSDGKDNGTHGSPSPAGGSGGRERSQCS